MAAPQLIRIVPGWTECGDVDAVFRKLLDQTWGTREFYVEDPDGNSVRFTQVLDANAE